MTPAADQRRQPSSPNDVYEGPLGLGDAAKDGPRMEEDVDEGEDSGLSQE